MALTRIQAEKTLLARAGKRMAFVEMDSTTIDGTNPDVVDPISTALMAMDITPADISNPVDSDLETVSIPEFLDRAELRLLENILGNADAVDISEGPRSESFGQFVSALETAIARKQDKIDAEYGGSLGSLSAGKITLNFTKKGND